MTSFCKKSEKKKLGANLGSFCSNLLKNEFSWRRGLCQFLNIPTTCQKSEKTNELFLRKMDGQTDGQTTVIL